MTLADYKVVLYRQIDGAWIAEVPAIGGCYALMDTREAALEELKRVFQLIAEGARGAGSASPHRHDPDRACLALRPGTFAGSPRRWVSSDAASQETTTAESVPTDEPSRFRCTLAERSAPSLQIKIDRRWTLHRKDTALN